MKANRRLTGIVFSKIIFIITFTFLFTQAGNAEAASVKFFESVPFGKYLYASIRTMDSYIETGRLNQFSPIYYLEKEGGFPVITLRFSRDIPLLAGELSNGNWGLVLPIQHTMVVDMFESESAPVLNNDSLFGFAIKYAIKTETQIIKNLVLRLTPVFHESTHIGDEFAMHGIQKVEDFYRVNVSYEAWELLLLVNDPGLYKAGLPLSFSFGISGLWYPNNGYYWHDPLETNNIDIIASRRRFEYFAGMQLKRQNGFAASEKWRNVFSLEVNNRVQYNYFVQEQEQRVWSVNLLAGYEYTGAEYLRTGLFLRYYYGLNPHGMFRMHYDHQFLGIVLFFS